MTKPARSCGRPDAAAAPGGPRAASFLGTATTGTQPATISFDSERGRTGLGGTSSGEYRRFRIATRFTPEIVPLPKLAGQSAEPPPDRAGAEGTRPTARQPPRRARPAMRLRGLLGPSSTAPQPAFLAQAHRRLHPCPLPGRAAGRFRRAHRPHPPNGPPAGRRGRQDAPRRLLTIVLLAAGVWSWACTPPAATSPQPAIATRRSP